MPSREANPIDANPIEKSSEDANTIDEVRRMRTHSTRVGGCVRTNHSETKLQIHSQLKQPKVGTFTSFCSEVDNTLLFVQRTRIKVPVDFDLFWHQSLLSFSMVAIRVCSLYIISSSYSSFQQLAEERKKAIDVPPCSAAVDHIRHVFHEVIAILCISIDYVILTHALNGADRQATQ